MNFYSLSQHPGKTGEKFYRAMFKKHHLSHSYTAQGTNDVKGSIQSLISLGADGISISMPFKKEVLDILDYSDNIVTQFTSCNTIKILDGKLYGYNTDFIGLLSSINHIPAGSKISILGDGAMGSMFKKILGDAEIYSRKLGNWDQRYNDNDVIINCTSYGTATSESPFESLPKTTLVIDLAIKENKLHKQCIESSIQYISGLEFYKYQFLKQFEIYTGIEIKIEDLEGL